MLFQGLEEDFLAKGARIGRRRQGEDLGPNEKLGTTTTSHDALPLCPRKRYKAHEWCPWVLEYQQDYVALLLGS